MNGRTRNTDTETFEALKKQAKKEQAAWKAKNDQATPKGKGGSSPTKFGNGLEGYTQKRDYWQPQGGYDSHARSNWGSYYNDDSNQGQRQYGYTEKGDNSDYGYGHDKPKGKGKGKKDKKGYATNIVRKFD